MDDVKDTLQAVLDNPDEDTPRRMHADALDERDGPGDAARAEFIRLQIALANDAYLRRDNHARNATCLEPGCPYCDASQRADDLIDPAWQLNDVSVPFDAWHKGFVESYRVMMWPDAHELLFKGLRRMLRVHPIRHVEPIIALHQNRNRCTVLITSHSGYASNTVGARVTVIPFALEPHLRPDESEGLVIRPTFGGDTIRARIVHYNFTSRALDDIGRAVLEYTKLHLNDERIPCTTSTS